MTKTANFPPSHHLCPVRPSGSWITRYVRMYMSGFNYLFRLVRKPVYDDLGEWLALLRTYRTFGRYADR